MTDDSSGDDDDDDPTDPFGRRVGPFDPEPSTATLPLVDEEEDFEDEGPEEPEPEPEPAEDPVIVADAAARTHDDIRLVVKWMSILLQKSHVADREFH